jgi:hypothetical protein
MGGALVKVVWKFHIQGALSEFDAPAGSVAICVQVQSGKPELYLLCLREAPRAKHQVACFTTGQNIPDDVGNYVGTVTFENPGGPLIVLHVFHKQLSIQLAS